MTRLFTYSSFFGSAYQSSTLLGHQGVLSQVFLSSFSWCIECNTWMYLEESVGSMATPEAPAFFWVALF